MFWFSVITLTILTWVILGRFIIQYHRKDFAEAKTSSARDDSRNQFLVAMGALIIGAPLVSLVVCFMWQLFLGLAVLAASILSVIVFGMWLHKRYIAK